MFDQVVFLGMVPIAGVSPRMGQTTTLESRDAIWAKWIRAVHDGDEEMARYYQYLLEEGLTRPHVPGEPIETYPFPPSFGATPPPVEAPTPPEPPPEPITMRPPTPTPSAGGLPCPAGQYRPAGSAWCVPIATPTAMARPRIPTVPFGSLFSGGGTAYTGPTT